MNKMVDIEVLRTVQKQLSRYLFSKGFLSWNGIRKACERIILSLPEREQRFFANKSYPEFEIFIPLLRNGSVEVCRSPSRTTLLFCMNPNTGLITKDGIEYARGKEYFSLYRTKKELELSNHIHENDIIFEPPFDPMAFLKSYTSIEKQICDFTEQQIQTTAFYLEQNIKNYQYTKKKPGDTDVGIYKLNEHSWTASYLVDKNKIIRKIPYYAEDPDAMNLARLYVRTYNEIFTKPIFEYNNDSQELTCNRYSEMPILLTRALLLFEPEQLTSKEFCTNHPTVPFRKVPEEAIKELKRIFSDKAIIIR
ncbi:MAG: hypothetical protein IKA80_09540 [Spirochaetaceae bacterium]|nr:hypothetical protein [Spirochaetaceae bacterium]